jgi:hypothetical protein
VDFGQYKNINLGKDILLCEIFGHRNIKHNCQIYREFVDAWNCLKVIPDPCTMHVGFYIRSDQFISKLSGLGDPFKLYNLCFGYFSTKKSKFSSGIMYLLNYLLAVVKRLY